jgi:hypothetical protein
VPIPVQVDPGRIWHIFDDSMLYQRSNRKSVPTDARQLRVVVLALECRDRGLGDAQSVRDVLLGDVAISAERDELPKEVKIVLCEDSGSSFEVRFASMRL